MPVLEQNTILALEHVGDFVTQLEYLLSVSENSFQTLKSNYMKNFHFFNASYHHLFLLAVMALIANGCKKDKSTESEVITKVSLHIVQIGGGLDHEFVASDPDGDGVFNTIDSIVLPVGVGFNCTVHLLDESKTPVVNVSDEVYEERNVHLFIHSSTVAGVGFIDRNLDSNGQPFGSEVHLITALVGSGTYRLRLLHEPEDKNAADPGGDVDVDVTFPLEVK